MKRTRFIGSVSQQPKRNDDGDDGSSFIIRRIGCFERIFDSIFRWRISIDKILYEWTFSRNFHLGRYYGECGCDHVLAMRSWTMVALVLLLLSFRFLEFDLVDIDVLLLQFAGIAETTG